MYVRRATNPADNEDILVEMLKKFVKKQGIIKASLELNYSEGYVWMMYCKIRPITDHLAEYFGYRRKITFVKIS